MAMFRVWVFLGVVATSLSQDPCTGTTDFGITYSGVTAFSVAQSNRACSCAGPLSSASGTSTFAGGLSVPNGQNLEVATAAGGTATSAVTIGSATSASTLTVFGTATFNGASSSVFKTGLQVDSGGTGAFLKFSNAYPAKKIVMYDSSNSVSTTTYNYFGFGISSGQLDYMVQDPSQNHVFYVATSATARSELLRIAGSTGLVTVQNALTVNGLVTAQNALTVNGPATFSSTTSSSFASGLLVDTSSTGSFLKFSNAYPAKKIVLYDGSNSASTSTYNYFGFGISNGQLDYMVQGPGENHVFYAATSASARTELLRLASTGAVTVPGSLSVTGGFATTNMRAVSVRDTRPYGCPVSGVAGTIISYSWTLTAAAWVTVTAQTIVLFNGRSDCFIRVDGATRSTSIVYTSPANWVSCVLSWSGPLAVGPHTITFDGDGKTSVWGCTDGGYYGVMNIAVSG